MKDKVRHFLDQVIAWAQARPEIIGLALAGSHARDEARQDSDIDLILLSDSSWELIKRPQWINNFGSLSSFSVEDWGRVTSLRVFYEDDLEVEFGLASPGWAEVPLDNGTRQVIAHGIQILVDKEGLISRALQEVSLEAGRGGRNGQDHSGESG